MSADTSRQKLNIYKILDSSLLRLVPMSCYTLSIIILLCGFNDFLTASLKKWMGKRYEEEVRVDAYHQKKCEARKHINGFL
jgi:hypothetical protein